MKMPAFSAQASIYMTSVHYPLAWMGREGSGHHVDPAQPAKPSPRSRAIPAASGPWRSPPTAAASFPALMTTPYASGICEMEKSLSP